MKKSSPSATIAILQARMGSSRLPGKVLREIDGVSLLEAQMARVESAEVEEKWIATTSHQRDDSVAEIGERRGWHVFRGDEEDVLSRFVAIIEISSPDFVIRLNADNPFMHAEQVTAIARQMSNVRQVDWIGDISPRRYPLGLSPEIVSAEALRRSFSVDDLPDTRHHSHVTTLVQRDGRLLQSEVFDFALDPDWRLTVDVEEDLKFVQELAKELGSSWLEATAREIAEVLTLNPGLTKINRHISQKSWSDG